ncbi:DUF485 domain-containing protein [Streptomyces sp. SLBN-115]|uniref:DUF485 domain-containing protein n=1 Tax=Streptomyces sp. SLBN-115 TaxID=2768453 RepID=UPI00114DD046|nr:DUF485 domain-containing protein [Streptomyces sp. SLBN-115]TQJ46608.1 uncharacterized membrane protein (DUF485 family) [Streptomyces sp. SLBN-115]
MSSDSSDLYPARHRPGRHASPTAIPRWAAPPDDTRLPDDKHLPADTRPPERAQQWTGRHRDLRRLRRACRWQRRVATFAALGYFAVFLTLTVEAPAVMTRLAPGGLPTGLCLALVQLPVTWLAVLLYEYTARRYVDPLARRVHRRPDPVPPEEPRP